jgi:hypothetical protein
LGIIGKAFNGGHGIGEGRIGAEGPRVIDDPGTNPATAARNVVFDLDEIGLARGDYQALMDQWGMARTPVIGMVAMGHASFHRENGRTRSTE